MPKIVEIVLSWVVITASFLIYVVLWLNPMWFRKDLLDTYKNTKFGWLVS